MKIGFELCWNQKFKKLIDSVFCLIIKQCFVTLLTRHQQNNLFEYDSYEKWLNKLSFDKRERLTFDFTWRLQINPGWFMTNRKKT